MSQYNTLKATIDANIYANHEGLIRGDILNSVLNQMVDSLKNGGYLFGGVLTPTTTLPTPDQKVAYLASDPGTYGSLSVGENELAVIKFDSSWSKSILNLSLEHPVGVDDSENDADLDISDEDGNVLARLENGHIRVKNFDSAKNNSNIGLDSVPLFSEEEEYTIGAIVNYGGLLYKFISDHEVGEWDETEVEKTNLLESGSHPIEVGSYAMTDLDICDENGNVLVRFQDGHIKTKEFDSNKTDWDIPCKPLFLLNKKTYDGIVATGWSHDINGIRNNGLLGYSNRLTLNREINANKRIVEWDLNIGTNSVVYIGTDQGTTSASGHVGIIINTANGTLKTFDNATESLIRNGLTFGTDPIRVRFIKESPMNYYHTRIEIIKLKSLSLIASIDGFEKPLYDKPICYATSGSVEIVNLSVKIARLSNDWKLAIYGDSITEGWWGLDKGWAYLVQSHLGVNHCSVSGRDSATISGVMAMIDSELSGQYKPEYVMVTIGTNGGNTIQNVSALVEKIKGYGCKPIINHVSCRLSGTQSAINSIIDAALAAMDDYVPCVRMDVATAKNFDLSQGANPDAFTSPSDGLHPNELGHRLMFEQVIKDCNIIFN